jgi:hypothetical protein
MEYAGDQGLGGDRVGKDSKYDAYIDIKGPESLSGATVVSKQSDVVMRSGDAENPEDQSDGK